MNELLIQTILASIYDGDDSYRDVAEACARDIQIALSTPKSEAVKPDTKEMLVFIGVRKVLSTLAEMLLHFDKEESNRLLDGLLREVQCLRDRRSASRNWNHVMDLWGDADRGVDLYALERLGFLKGTNFDRD